MQWSSLTRICRGQPNLEGTVDALNLCQSGEQIELELNTKSHTHTHRVISVIKWDVFSARASCCESCIFYCLHDILFLCLLFMLLCNRDTRKWAWISCICECGAGCKEYKHWWTRNVLLMFIFESKCLQSCFGLIYTQPSADKVMSSSEFQCHFWVNQ